jgi:hypothetical protein
MAVKRFSEGKLEHVGSNLRTSNQMSIFAGLFTLLLLPLSEANISLNRNVFHVDIHFSTSVHTQIVHSDLHER